MMDVAAIDQARLNFDPTSLQALNAALGIVMFGVALDLSIDDFKAVAQEKLAFVVGLSCQFFLLPAVTFGLIQLLNPHPSIALGMLLVAACPGGNISNFITHLGRGNTALSVSMSAVSTSAAVVMTPFNIAFWGSMDEGTAALMSKTEMDPIGMLSTVGILLGIPLVTGMTVAAKAPGLTAKIIKPMKVFSLVFFAAFVAGALAKNWDYFVVFIGAVAGFVALQNAVALGIGYGSARLVGQPERNARAIAVEVGIQNSGLGLILIFNFFGGLGGMAVTAAWWGIWHVFSGMGLATFWNWKDRRLAALEAGGSVG